MRFSNPFRRALAILRHFYSRFVFLTFPYRWLPPILRFKRDGWNERIYGSVPPSNDETHVVIFGGYLGRSIDDWMGHLPRASFDVFEPVIGFAERIRDTFSPEVVRVHRFGIAADNEVRTFRLLGDATSDAGTHVHSKRHSEVEIPVEFKSVYLLQHILPPDIYVLEIEIPVQFKSVHLLEHILPPEMYVLEINIEGGEYELFPLLARHQILTRVEHLFIQFHDLGIETENAITQVRSALAETHYMEWNYHLDWEYWKRRA